MQDERSILILEDDPQWQLIASQILKREDHSLQIKCVPTSHEAIDLLSAGEVFDLIVADQSLASGMTGIEFFKHLRKQNDKTSFVMLSGLADQDFHELTSTEREFPKFVSKANAAAQFGAVVRAELKTDVATAELLPTKTLVNPLMIAGGALCVCLFAAAQISISQYALTAEHSHPAATSFTQPESLTGSRFNALKENVLTGKAKAPVSAARSPHVATVHPYRFVSPTLKMQVGRIVKRADSSGDEAASSSDQSVNQ